jgi:hypothetical protein
MRLVVDGIRAELHINELLTEALLNRMGLGDDMRLNNETQL